MLALVVILSVAPASIGACEVDGPGHASKRLEEATPQLLKGGLVEKQLARLLRGARAVDVDNTLEVDERHLRFTLVVDKLSGTARMPLALPLPWSGSVELVPRTPSSTCAPAEVVLFDKELRQAELRGLPLDVTVTVGKKGQAGRSWSLKQDRLVVAPGFIELFDGDSTTARFYVGAGPPGDDVLAADGPERYMASLEALGADVVEDIRNSPSAQAQRVLFAEMAASLRASLRTWTPERRIAEIARFEEKNMPPELRPLLHFWKEELGVHKERSDRTARLLVDDAVTALWIDGVMVFDRKQQMPTGVELRVPKDAVRAWIVSNDTSTPGATTPVVHDTRAVLRAGEIYSVTATFVQHVRMAARRECVRVGGELPFQKDIRWREVAGTNTALLDDGESYRPSTPSAERVLTVVPGGDARPFPPVPLIYSYTHPGTYKWTLARDGGVTLELVDDPSICAATR